MVTSKDCNLAIEFLQRALNTYSDNERFNGENWHYQVKKENINFDSFIFNNLAGLIDTPLINFYQELYSLYNNLGEQFDFKSFNNN